MVSSSTENLLRVGGRPSRRYHRRPKSTSRASRPPPRRISPPLLQPRVAPTTPFGLGCLRVTAVSTSIGLPGSCRSVLGNLRSQNPSTTASRSKNLGMSISRSLPPGSSPTLVGLASLTTPVPVRTRARWGLKSSPVIARGNAVPPQPAETTSLTALLFAEILQQAELPPGVVNIITGAGATGAALVAHEDVDKVAFTGSTEVGRSIARQVAGTSKRLTLELGGKAANIVFDDAPLDEAIEGIVNGIFFNQGQVCCAGSRLLVQENIHDEVIERLQSRLATLRLGDPLDKNTDIGALNSREQLERITELAAVGEAEGAQRWSSVCDIPTTGFWFAPTIFTGVHTSSRIAREEIFGPVLSVLTFRTTAEAIAKANNTPYGLSAGIWSEKGSRVLAVADALRAGVVWANTFNRFDPTSPFGGYKESGYGREGGRHGLAAYLTASGDNAPLRTAAETQGGVQ